MTYETDKEEFEAEDTDCNERTGEYIAQWIYKKGKK